MTTNFALRHNQWQSPRIMSIMIFRQHTYVFEIDRHTIHTISKKETTDTVRITELPEVAFLVMNSNLPRKKMFRTLLVGRDAFDPFNSSFVKTDRPIKRSWATIKTISFPRRRQVTITQILGNRIHPKGLVIFDK
jgi:hypothetical protein